jgi:hypothetical protein
MAGEQIVDGVVNPLYDTNNIVAAGALTLNYFALPIGQGQSAFAAAGITKSLVDTNLQLSGQLSAGYNFDLLGFRIQPQFNIGNIAGMLPTNDPQTWSFGCLFTFSIGSKIYCQVPADTVPAGCGPVGAQFGIATGVGVTGGSVTAHGVPHISNAFMIGRNPQRLSQNMVFNATLTWPIVVANTSVTPTAAADGIPVRVYLDGTLYRPVQ